jgi:hypothetical protein
MVSLRFNNVRLYTGLIQELHGLIGRSRLVGLHYRLRGPESAQCALGRCAAPIHRVPSSRPGDPTSEHWELVTTSVPHKWQAWVYNPTIKLDLGIEPPANLPRVIAHVM